MTGRPDPMALGGDADPGYEAVIDVFRSTLAGAGAEPVGGALAVYRDGRPVVDLWGGLADRRFGVAWDRRTAALIFSCTKGVMAIAAYRLVEEGLLNLDAPVADYWPGFARRGKEKVTTRMILSHRAGLPVIDLPLTRGEVLAWTPVIAAIEAQAPIWEPGTAHTYHAKTYGWLIGEVIRRITGRSPGTFVRDVLVEPLGLELWIGLPDDQAAHVAWTEAPEDDGEPGSDWTAEARVIHDRALTLDGTFPFPADDDGIVTFNDPEIRAAELPGGNGISTARALARLYAACIGDIDGVRVLRDDSLDDALVERSSGPQRYGSPIGGFRWGTGFQLDAPGFRPLLGDHSFGHDGAGGQLAFADPDLGVAFAYVTARMGGPEDDRSMRLVEAVRRVLGIRRAT